jgi:hypothetical protein
MVIDSVYGTGNLEYKERKKTFYNVFPLEDHNHQYLDNSGSPPARCLELVKLKSSRRSFLVWWARWDSNPEPMA